MTRLYIADSRAAWSPAALTSRHPQPMLRLLSAFCDTLIRFLRTDVPENWRDYCGSATDNFRVIDTSVTR